jgi:hypothetical protein
MTVAKTACLFCHVPLSKVDYESGSGKVCITIEASRKASSVWVDIDDVSEAFLPYEPRVGKRAIQPATNGKPY